MNIARFFQSNPQHYEGVRPVHIAGLRLLYLLMLLFVAPTAWRVLLTHQGEWAALPAVAWSVWATYPALALFGLLQPLRWLPLLLFTLGYKAIWLSFVALPLWRAGTLQGSSAQPVAESFLALPLLALVIPWGYVWKTYIVGTAKPAAQQHAAVASP